MANFSLLECFSTFHNYLYKSGPLQFGGLVYLKNILEIYKPTRALRSAQDNLILKKPIMNYKSYGEKSFYFYGPFVWNSLPFQLRDSQNIDTFKKHLKTYLVIKKAYNI